MQLPQPRVVEIWIKTMQSLVVINTKEDVIYMINPTDNEYIRNFFADRLQEQLKFRFENVNLILNSDFRDVNSWKIVQNNNNKSEITNNIDGFRSIGPANILCIYSKNPGNKSTTIQYEHNIPLIHGKDYNFNMHVASHRCSGSVFIELCDENGVTKRVLHNKIPLDIEGGMQLDKYLLISFDFKSNYNEKYAKVFIEKSTTLNVDDSFLFLTRPWFGFGRSENSGWRPCHAALTHVALCSITQNLEPQIYLLSNMGNKTPDTLNEIKEIISNNLEDMCINLMLEEKIDFDSIIANKSMYNTTHKKALRVTIGTVLYNNTASEIANLEFYSDLSLSFCKEKLSEYAIDFSFIYIDNSPAALLGVDPMRHWNKLENKTNLGFARGHNKLMNFAFNEDSSDYYIMLNPDGYPFEACFKEMIELAVEDKNIGLVEAIQFPMEHPKPYDSINLDTPWCSGACLLVSRTAYLETNGFDEHFAMYCEDVDFSWRVKSRNMMIKVAPKALFFHDTRSRSSKSVQKNMYLSGRYLGHKWGARDFVNWTEDLLISNGFFPEKVYLPILPENQSTLDIKYAEFRQGFYFALPRWH